MHTFQDVPQEVLRSMLSEAVHMTYSKGWQLSLRQVNRQFNEILLHVFYLQKKFVPGPQGTSLFQHSHDCLYECDRLCQEFPNGQKKFRYLARFALQGWLARSDIPETTLNGQRKEIRQQLKAALTTLRDHEPLAKFNTNPIPFYSTCSNNPVFNEIPSVVLAEAISSYQDSISLVQLTERDLRPGFLRLYYTHPFEFWVALSACVLGDLQLCKTYIEKLTFLHHQSSPSHKANRAISRRFSGILMVAIEHGRLEIVQYLLDVQPDIMSNTCEGGILFRKAIFGRDNEILKVLLKYTPSSHQRKMINATKARYEDHVHELKFNMLKQSDESSETIRLLASHFAPLCEEGRRALLFQSCAIGDASLVAEFNEPFGKWYGRWPWHREIASHVHLTMRQGNMSGVRVMLDHEVVRRAFWDDGSGILNQNQIHLYRALSYNQIDCFRELFRHWNTSWDASYLPFLAMAENAEEMMEELISKCGDSIHEEFSENDCKDEQPSFAQLALVFAIHRLRSENVKYLLGKEVRPFLPWKIDVNEFEGISLRRVKNPFDIRWPYFNMNRDGYQCTQAVLDTFNLPKLRVIV